MRILQILSQKELTGAEVYALTLTDWLIKNGHHVVIVSDALHKRTEASFISRPVDSSKIRDRVSNVIYLRKLIKTEQIQIIHTHSRAAARVAYWARFGLPIALINTAHGRQHYSFSKRVFDIYGDRVICVCENIKKGLLKHFRMNSRKLKVIPNPIDPGGDLEKNINLQENKNPFSKIAWIGRFTGPKGKQLEKLLNFTFETLLKNNMNLTIDLIGGKMSSLSYNAQKKFLDLQNKYPDRIRHLEFIENIDQNLRNYDLVIAAGRIAISCLIQEIPCFAMGEYKALGLTRPSNFIDFMKSNFGDISVEYDDEVVSENEINSLFDECIQKSLTLLDKKYLKKNALQHFEINIVCKRIYQIYESAYFQKLFPQPIPILMYHKIPDKEINSSHRIFVTTKRFESHLKFYQFLGFKTLTFQELDEFRQLKRSPDLFPKKPLILTFDDGYVDNLNNAAPLLKRFNFRGVIYLLADHSMNYNSWDIENDSSKIEPKCFLMNSEERKKLKNSPFEIGSHGLRHSKMTDMSLDEAFIELSESKKILEKEFDQPIISFAFTYGLTNPELSELAQRAGYRFALNTSSGGLHLEEDPYSIFRVNIFPEESLLSLWKKTSWWYRKYFYWKKKN